MSDLLPARRDADLDAFLASEDDGLIYIGHASILVRLNRKTFLFDPVGYSSPYFNCWVFFPPQILDRRLLKVDAVIVSHCHQDHFDVELLRLFPKTTPVFIVGGRPAFEQAFIDAGLAFRVIPPEVAVSIAEGVEVYAVLHESNGIDASLIIKNDNFSAYHGNDNYASPEALRRLRARVDHVDVACVPFAYIHWYPFLLDGVDDAWRADEARRLTHLYLDIGLEQAEILDATIVMPFGANLVYYDDVNSVMNRAVLSPLDFVAYAHSKPAPHPERFLPMFAGDRVTKPRAAGGDLVVDVKPRTDAAFKAQMQAHLEANPARPPDLDARSVRADVPTDFTWLQERLRRYPGGRFAHSIRLEGPGPDPVKVEVDLSTFDVAVVDDWRGVEPYHHFRLEAEPMAHWLQQRVTLEGVIGMRRFRLERVPDRYDPQILALINNAL